MSATRTPGLLVALHDVAPVHRERIEKAERTMAEAGVTRVAYLLVPHFHREARADQPEFIAWCRAKRPFDVQWLLHGYFHDDRATDTYMPTIGERLASAFMTDHEAECLMLGPAVILERIRDGMGVFESCIGAAPGGFVAPGWLFNRHLFGALAACQIDFTEDHTRI